MKSHLIPLGRVTDLMGVEGDIYKPLDIEIIWELYYLKDI